MSRPMEPGDFQKPLDEVFSDFVDGRLSPEQRVTLRQRLDRDPVLRREFERFQRMLAVLHAERSLELERAEVEAPPELNTRILAALHDDRGSGRPPGGGRSLLPYLASLFSAAAAVLLFLVLLPHERPRTGRDVLRVGEVTVVDEDAAAAPVEERAQQLAAGKSRGADHRRESAPGQAAQPQERAAYKEAAPRETRGGGYAEPDPSAAKGQQPAKKAPEQPGWAIPQTGGGGGGGKAAAPQGAAKDGTGSGAAAPEGTVALPNKAPVGVEKEKAEKEKQVALLQEDKPGEAAVRQRKAGDSGREGPTDPFDAGAPPAGAAAASRKLDDATRVASRPGAPTPTQEAPVAEFEQREERKAIAALLDAPDPGLATSESRLATGVTCLSVTVGDDLVQSALEQSFAGLQPQVLYAFQPAAPGDQPAPAADSKNLEGWLRGQTADSRALSAGDGSRYLLRFQAPVERLRESLIRFQSSPAQRQSRVVSLDPGLSARFLAPDSQWRFGWPRGEEVVAYGERFAQAEESRRGEAERDAGADQFAKSRAAGGAPASGPATGRTAFAESGKKAENEAAAKESLDKERADQRADEEHKAKAADVDKAEQSRLAATARRAGGAGARSAPGAASAPAGPAAPKGPGPTSPGPAPVGKPSETPAPMLKRAYAGNDQPIDFYLLLIYPRAARLESKAGK